MPTSSTESTVDAELEILRAEAAVRRLLSQYAQAADDGRVEDLGALFIADGQFRARGQTLTGPSAIAEFLRGRLQPDNPGRHVVFNTIVELEPDGARAVSDFLMVRRIDGVLVNEVAGRFHDRFVHTTDGWRFADHDVVFC